jgi:hypothetical protein
MGDMTPSNESHSLKARARGSMREMHVEAIHLSDGRRAPCLLRLLDRTPESPAYYQLEAVFGEKSWTRHDSDYFASLALIRRDLEADGWLLSCYGASKNVYPSGMCRDMGGGLSAYKTRMGERGRRSDMVDIFETGPDVEPATVDEQTAFNRRWTESLN